MKIIIFLILLSFPVTGIILADIRMTNDPKPNVYVYKLKDVGDGSISFRISDMDDNQYDVGDMFILPDTAGHYGGNAPEITIKHKYIVLSIKEVNK